MLLYFPNLSRAFFIFVVFFYRRACQNGSCGETENLFSRAGQIRRIAARRLRSVPKGGQWEMKKLLIGHPLGITIRIIVLRPLLETRDDRPGEDKPVH